tara:strand:+ start:472 stop:903 length:432 start_codon:yes stop_codon:yes gene_type:complete
MWMRIAAALAVAGLAVLVVTCGGDVIAGANGGSGAGDPASSPPDANSGGGPTAGPSTVPSIACAPDGSPAFDSTCTIERYELDGANLMAVFHPDGGFRRFEQLADGSGLAAVAGADEVTQMLDGDILEISIAGDRYRFPTTTQ